MYKTVSKAHSALTKVAATGTAIIDLTARAVSSDAFTRLPAADRENVSFRAGQLITYFAQTATGEKLLPLATLAGIDTADGWIKFVEQLRDLAETSEPADREILQYLRKLKTVWSETRKLLAA